MNYNELLEAAELVEASGPCETIGHWSFVKAARAVIELHQPIFRGCNDDACCGSTDTCGHCGDTFPCDTLSAIEKELRGD